MKTIKQLTLEIYAANSVETGPLDAEAFLARDASLPVEGREVARLLALVMGVTRGGAVESALVSREIRPTHLGVVHAVGIADRAVAKDQVGG